MHGAPGGMSRGAMAQPHGQFGQAQGGHSGQAQRFGETQPHAQTHGQMGQAHQNGRVGEMNRQVQPNRRAETTGRGEAHRGFAEERGREMSGHQMNCGRIDTGRDNHMQEGQRAFDSHAGRRDGTTTGQGAASSCGAASLTSEQRTRVHEAFARENNVPRLGRANFDVAVGRRVPRSVHFIPVPEAIYGIAPVWRGYDYFEVADEIVIVDPVTFEIIAVLPV